MTKLKMNLSKLLFLIIVPLLLGFLYNYIRHDSLSLIRQEVKVEIVNDFQILDSNHSNNEATDLKGINLATVLKLIESGNMTLIDARDQWDFAEGHIPGSINIPQFSFEPNDQAILFMDKSKLYVVYCDGDDCDTSKRLAGDLSKAGFTNLYVYLGGFNEWIETGNKIETGE